MIKLDSDNSIREFPEETDSIEDKLSRMSMGGFKSPFTPKSLFRGSNITKEKVTKAIKGLNSGKASDLYGITSEHLTKAADVVAESLSHIFQHIFNSRNVPSEVKKGTKTPIPKKGKDPP